jgi:bifunctional UDP-N-acetylglucosamine pyrophosphorylase/glucosamine-1-phosphate N-acetyltransferase
MNPADGANRPPLAVLLLAAGKGTRLGLGPSAPPKVMLECLGLPLLEHVRRALAPLEADATVVVTGHGAEDVEAWLGANWPAARPALQEPQNGTGHAVRVALEAIPDFEGDVLVAYGDVPQLQGEDLARLLAGYREAGVQAALLTGVTPDPALLGRVVRAEDGGFTRIVEARDATPAELAIQEFNTGIYAFDAGALRAAVSDLPQANAQGEEYVTDAVGRIRDAGGGVAAIPALDPRSLLGVNDYAELSTATRVLRLRTLEAHMRAGVCVVDPDTTTIEADVEIEAGARILPFTHIGRGCRIGAGASVGPFARLRGGTVLHPGAEVGNFVEVKASTIRAGAKAKHLTYLGDADVGEKANIGCGVITANYDGVRKHPTSIGAGARIGSGTILVAPVAVGPGAVTGANATVLAGHDVPPGATAVGVPARVVGTAAPGDGEKPETAGPQGGATHEEGADEPA